ncbi:ABC transporter permease [Actinacidiphila guanduensis]|uniref:Peptide/nickel transport system permease protein n=1 Tax=Actinacidiphila guanduensis TaxID=310781 RepID=A0A1H0PZG9_9ACTN|nr:ABC transporter permease [Actinacidiphila guanduensis]SDP10552.1 peptide/nickel transport system permease protein [Actinacidiphila guanduensis]
MRNHRTLVPAIVIALYVLVALCAPLIAPFDPNHADLAARLSGPFATTHGHFHLLGTDGLGRDVLSRIIYGSRVSLAVAAATVLVSGAFGVTLGVVAGWRRGWLAAVIMRLADIALSVPFFLLAILVVAVLGPSLVNVVICLSLVRWPRYTRIAYANVLETRERGFVRGAVAVGAPGRWIVLRHILPEVAPLAVVVGTLELGLMVVFEASLSFIGLGVQPPTASWGSMLSDGQQYVASAWWLATFPGLALFGLVLTVNLLGDAVRDRLDPRRRVPRRVRRRRPGLGEPAAEPITTALEADHA